jgi:hypothetical protein
MNPPRTTSHYRLLARAILHGARLRLSPHLTGEAYRSALRPFRPHWWVRQGWAATAWRIEEQLALEEYLDLSGS